MLKAISPIDGRYASKVKDLEEYFSEYALIKYRLWVEIKYFIALLEFNLPELGDFPDDRIDDLLKIVDQFDLEDAKKVKDIESVTNHDVKAVEYFIKEKFEELGLSEFSEFIHFGLTSQDINNTAVPLALKQAFQRIYLPRLQEVIEQIEKYSKLWADLAMLARTHGQPASPTLLGKEFKVFSERLNTQLENLKGLPFEAKFGGATGNLNAHFAAYPDRDWIDFANHFVNDQLGLKRQQTTTQIEHYDGLAALFHGMMRINTILIDLARDIWTYISMDYFKQKVVKDEVGSSAMPHKVNPIDFENAEGNLGLANSIFSHLASKLPVSRLQRDLTDSTVSRNIGVPLAHTEIAFNSLLKGLSKLEINSEAIENDLDNNWAVLAEAIQTILRKEGYPKPYEALKELTRGKKVISREDISQFVDQLKVDDDLKSYLKSLRPDTYTGKFKA
jgi:adenylosuccinate lyase